MLQQIVFDPVFLDTFFFILSAVFAYILSSLFDITDYLSILSIHVIVLFLFLLLEIVDPAFYVMLVMELLIIVYSIRDKRGVVVE